MISIKKFIIVPLALAGFILGAATYPDPPEEHKAENLKVLPKNISHDDLHDLMDHYKDALGVKCNFCHAQSKIDPKKLDFASDENRHKDIARKMIKMTAALNKKYFKDFKHEEGKAMNAISCVSCHNGEKHPKSI